MWIPGKPLESPIFKGNKLRGCRDFQVVLKNRVPQKAFQVYSSFFQVVKSFPIDFVGRVVVFDMGKHNQKEIRFEKCLLQLIWLVVSTHLKNIMGI